MTYDLTCRDGGATTERLALGVSTTFFSKRASAGSAPHLTFRTLFSGAMMVFRGAPSSDTWTGHMRSFAGGCPVCSRALLSFITSVWTLARRRWPASGASEDRFPPNSHHPLSPSHPPIPAIVLLCYGPPRLLIHAGELSRTGQERPGPGESAGGRATTVG
jgi:hypothetical protein